jgi:hypothetical protein
VDTDKLWPRQPLHTLERKEKMALPCPACGQLQKGALSTKHFAQLAGISPESAANACQEGRVPGAEKVRVTANSWLWRIQVSEAVVSLLNKYRAQRSRPHRQGAEKTRHTEPGPIKRPTKAGGAFHRPPFFAGSPEQLRITIAPCTLRM